MKTCHEVNGRLTRSAVVTLCGVLSVISPVELGADTYRMQLQAETATNQLRGSLDLGYVNTGQQPVSQVRLRLDGNLGRMDSIKVLHVRDSDGKELAWDHRAFKIRQAAIGESHRWRSHYQDRWPLAAGSTCRSPFRSMTIGF